MVNKVFKRNVNEAFEACISALNKIEARITEQKKNEGIITASMKGSFLSWGEDIFIKISGVNNNQTKIEIESSAKAQIIDWGVNDNNEHKIMSLVAKSLNS